MCVCLPLRLLIISGVIWTPYDNQLRLNKFCSCYMAIVVGIVNGHGLGIDTCHGNYPIKLSYRCIMSCKVSIILHEYECEMTLCCFDSLLCVLSQKNNTPLTISSHSTPFDLLFPCLCLFKLVILNYKSV